MHVSAHGGSATNAKVGEHIIPSHASSAFKLVLHINNLHT